MDLVTILVMMIAGGLGFGVRMGLTRLIPGFLKKRLSKLKGRNLVNKVRPWLKSGLDFKVAITSGIPALIPFLLIPIDYALYPLLGYLLGLINWPSLIKKKFDLGWRCGVHLRYPGCLRHHLVHD